MSDRTKRLSRLGNAVVPQVAEWIGRQLLAHERKNCRASSREASRESPVPLGTQAKRLRATS